MGRQDYKNNSDQKVVKASAATKKATEAADATAYAEEAKNPLKTYVGPSDLGSVTVQYPKTWSTYVAGADSKTLLDVYMHPDTVPDVSEDTNTFSLRIQVIEQAYDQVLAGFDQEVKNSTVRVAPYTLTKVPSVVGSLLVGAVEPKKSGSMVIFPLRNLTLKVWTDSNDYLADFEKIILPNLSFSP